MVENGFQVEVIDTKDLTAVKQRYGVPGNLQACHTAVIDGYVIEGHVPATEVKRLLAEKPTVSGLAVPGMPVGSPGMEVVDAGDQFYEVFSFDSAGKITVFASIVPD